MKEFLKLLDNDAARAAIKRLKASCHNVLAFSHGTDSTALFYALLSAGVSFSAALINYRAREGADAEQLAARKLCEHYGVEFYTITAPRLSGNFEQAARSFRYEFFASLKPECLITAHNLNDQIEWLLMRLARGAGLVNLGIMSALVEQNAYTLVRPFVRVEKTAILDALNTSGVEYFNDPSNTCLNFERNKLRSVFVNDYAAANAAGLAKSLDFLSVDVHKLAPKITHFAYFKAVKISADLGILSAALAKAFGALLSQKSQAELASQLKQNTDAIAHTPIGDLVFGVYANHLICARFISSDSAFSKQQKESFRLNKIPPKLRSLCALHPSVLADLLKLY